jgi:hypothetical protein
MTLRPYRAARTKEPVPEGFLRAEVIEGTTWSPLYYAGRESPMRLLPTVNTGTAVVWGTHVPPGEATVVRAPRMGWRRRRLDAEMVVAGEPVDIELNIERRPRTVTLRRPSRTYTLQATRDSPLKAGPRWGSVLTRDDQVPIAAFHSTVEVREDIDPDELVLVLLVDVTRLARDVRVGLSRLTW